MPCQQFFSHLLQLFFQILACLSVSRLIPVIVAEADQGLRCGEVLQGLCRITCPLTELSIEIGQATWAQSQG